MDKQKNFDRIIENAEFSKNLSWAFGRLHEYSRSHFTINQKKLDLLFRNAPYADELAKAFNLLGSSFGGVTEKNFYKLIKNAEQSVEVAQVLIENNGVDHRSGHCWAFFNPCISNDTLAQRERAEDQSRNEDAIQDENKSEEASEKEKMWAEFFKFSSEYSKAKKDLRTLQANIHRN